MTGITFSSDGIVVKSPNDRRLYRLIELENGLRALLVHDPEIYPEGRPSKASESDNEEMLEADNEEDENDDEDGSEDGDDDYDDIEDEDGEVDHSDGEVELDGWRALLFNIIKCPWSG